MAQFKNQHLVSQVVQKRFTAESGPQLGRLVRIRREDPSALEYVGPRGNLRENWFINKDANPGRFEAVWQKAESQMDGVYVELDSHAGAGAVSSEAGSTIADVMALHLIRSPAVKDLWERSLSVVRPRRLAAIAADADFIERARSTGMFEPRQTPLEIAAAITADFEDPLKAGGEAFGEILVEQYEAVRATFEQRFVEIAEAVDAEFVLPDVPCVPFESASKRAGLLAGVGLNLADAIIMPLGPRHLASLVPAEPDEPWVRLSASGVAPINEALALATKESAYCRPGSGLETALREAWAGVAQVREGDEGQDSLD